MARNRRTVKVFFGLCVLIILLLCGFWMYFKLTSWWNLSSLRIGGSSESINIVAISVDGLRPDAIIKAQAKNILRMRDKGAYTFNARTVIPSWTVPAHISMGTGLQPSRHGIRTNRFETVADKVRIAEAIRQYKTGKVKTIADYAKLARNMRTVFVISQTSDFQPELRVLIGLRNLDVLHKVQGSSLSIANTASTEFQSNEPLLLLVHFKEVDEVGHEYGWMSDEQLQAVKRVDEAIGVLLNDLEKSPKRRKTYVILTSDHGGHNELRADGTVYGTHGTDSDEDMNIPWFLTGPNVRSGHKIKAPVSVCDTTATIIHVLGLPFARDLDGKPVFEAFR